MVTEESSHVAPFEMSQDDIRQLSVVLGCQADGLDAELKKYLLAAREEYVQMFLGRRVFTRGSDIREYRLLLLIRLVWKSIPSESQISALFQTTATQSRSLLRAVLSKYQYELEGIISSSLQSLVEDAAKDHDAHVYILAPPSSNNVEALNLLISSLDPELRPITRKPDTVSAYIVTQDSREALLKHWKPNG